MREMKNSGVAWIGDIPTTWEIRRIKTLPDHNVQNSFIDGDWIESPYITNEGIRYLTTGNIGDGKYKEQGSGYISEETFTKLNCKYAYPGDLVISRLNAPYGRACILPDTQARYVLAVDVVILRTIENKRYLCYLSQCPGYQRSVEDMARGTAMKRISRSNLGTIQLPIPSIEEQYHIADYLDIKCTQVDTLISNVQAQIEKLKQYKQSLITEVVTKGLNPDAEMKDSGVAWIGDIPRNWEVIKTGRLFKENNRKPFGGDTPLSLSQVDGLVATDDMKESSLKTSTYDNWKRVEIDDLVLNRFKAHLGVLFAAELTGIVSFHYGVYEAQISLLPKYYEYLYHSEHYRAILGCSSNGMVVGLQNLSNLNFYSTYSLYPPYCEQKLIVSYLDEQCEKIDKLIEIKQSKIAKLNEYKKSLIYEYVTGKKEVV